MKDRPWGDVISNTGPVMWTQVINQWKARHDPGKLSTLILPCEYFCAGSGLCVPVTNHTILMHQFAGTWRHKQK